MGCCFSKPDDPSIRLDPIPNGAVQTNSKRFLFLKAIFSN